MSSLTKIEWADATFNPWWGCVKVSPACDHCYAESFSKRIGYSEAGSRFPIWGKDAKRRFFGDEHWAEPVKWNRNAEKSGKRMSVFCGSMCDVMEEHPDLQHSRVRLYNLIDDTPWLDWLLLTKRPQNFRRFLPKTWLDRPRANVLGMTTVESSEYLWRAEELLNTPFVRRGLSIEPLLGDLDLVPYLRFEDCGGGHRVRNTRIDWVIVGGESGGGARAMNPEWARSIRDQCLAARVPFFFKQWGEYHPAEIVSTGSIVTKDGQARPSVTYSLPAYCGSRWGAVQHVGDAVMIRVGKTRAGRLLDGCEWNGVPRFGRNA